MKGLGLWPLPAGFWAMEWPEVMEVSSPGWGVMRLCSGWWAGLMW
jgi:hypothetical protein